MKINLPQNNSVKKENTKKVKKEVYDTEITWVEEDSILKGKFNNKEFSICKETYTLKLNDFMKINCESIENAKEKANKLLT